MEGYVCLEMMILTQRYTHILPNAHKLTHIQTYILTLMDACTYKCSYTQLHTCTHTVFTFTHTYKQMSLVANQHTPCLTGAF